jgi:hypothetical protein
MPRPSRIVWLLLALPPALFAQASSIDTTGIPLFWQIHDVLAADREPGDSLWNALWRTPGYAMLQERERRRPALTTAMRLAFRPTLRDSADILLRQDGWIAWATRHLRTVAMRRDTLAKAQAGLTTAAAFDSARRLAARYLPASALDAPPPPVSLLYFLDARGYPTILLDPSYLLDLYDPLPVLGHELHHYYRNNRDRSGNTPFGDDMIAWRLATTETEGIAGLVDKADIPRLSREELAARYLDDRHRTYFEDYQEEYKRSDQWLAWVDNILTRASAHPDSAAELGRVLDQRLPDNGRIVGAYMATVIADRLGHEALIAVVGNPWDFWRTYNRAARTTGGRSYVISAVSMSAIDRLEQRYR